MERIGVRLKQKTMGTHLEVGGIGLHSGKYVSMRLLPAESGGVVFRPGNDAYRDTPASFGNVLGTSLGTSVGSGDKSFRVSTIEHLMAAIWACDLDNLLIEMDGEEIPILDGSSRCFVDKIRKCGTAELAVTRKILEIRKLVSVGNAGGSIEIGPSKGFSIDMEVDFNYGKIGSQHYFFDGTPETFVDQVALARTFCSVEDVERMRAMGLARGGSMDNAMVFGEEGLLNPEGFRCQDEVVKHKVLDCVGDMFTSGYRIRGAVVARRSGHGLNNELIRKIFADNSSYLLE
jgi:UDP-3-O-[3-hydroxymyristoyl] N-acetylglucosamine deacetylase